MSGVSDQVLVLIYYVTEDERTRVERVLFSELEVGIASVLLKPGGPDVVSESGTSV